jgi:hypothetical protein
MPVLNLGWNNGCNDYGSCGISQSPQANSWMVHLSVRNSFFTNIRVSSVANDPSFLVFVIGTVLRQKQEETK